MATHMPRKAFRDRDRGHHAARACCVSASDSDGLRRKASWRWCHSRGAPWTATRSRRSRSALPRPPHVPRLPPWLHQHRAEGMRRRLERRRWRRRPRASASSASGRKRATRAPRRRVRPSRSARSLAPGCRCRSRAQQSRRSRQRRRMMAERRGRRASCRLLVLGAAAPGHFCWRSDGVQAQRGVTAAVVRACLRGQSRFAPILVSRQIKIAS